MRWRGEAYDLSRMQIETRIVIKKDRKEYCEDREKKYHGGVLLSTFVMSIQKYSGDAISTES